MITDIANAEDEIGGKLMLNLKAPVLDHPRAAEFRGDIIGETSIQQSGVLCVGRRSETRKPGVERLHRSETILRFEIRSCGRPARKCVTKVRVAEGRIIDPVSTADHRLTEPFASEQPLGSVRKADARREILIVSLRSRSAAPINQGSGNTRRNRHSSIPAVEGGQVQNGLGAGGFVPRRIHLVTQTNIKSQVFAEFKVVLDISDVVI